MAEILVTGGTGMLGNAIARLLVAKGHKPRILARRPTAAEAVLPRTCRIIEGDLTDPESVRTAMQGCSVVFHAAGMPEQWRQDPTDFQRINVCGTKTVVELAIELEVERLVYTSTIDVFEFQPGVPFDETMLSTRPQPSPYEQSKLDAHWVVERAITKGLDAVTLHPSALYGPGPMASPGLNQLIIDLLNGNTPMLLKGWLPVVRAEDAAMGHLLAWEKAEAGARYNLSESVHALDALAKKITEIARAGSVPPVMPSWIAHTVSCLGELASKVTRTPPLLAAGQLHFVESHVVPDSSRAIEELEWSPSSLDQGLAETIAWLRADGKIPRRKSS